MPAKNVCDKVENWVPLDWMKLNRGLSSAKAKEIILDNGITIGYNINRKELAKKLCLY